VGRVRAAGDAGSPARTGPRRPALAHPGPVVEERVRAHGHHLLGAAYVRATFARDERRAARTLAAMLTIGDPEAVNAAQMFGEEAVLRWTRRSPSAGRDRPATGAR
jgi:hypothetical protein